MAVKVLFVCSGNICRSPTAEGVFIKLLEKEGLLEYVEVDSAGTHGFHAGEPPDSRSMETALARGIDLSDLRAREIGLGDFEEFDYLLAMTREHHRFMQQYCPREHQDKIRLFLEFATDLPADEVPDPYYGGASGFEHVLDLVEAGCQALLDHIIENHIRVMR